MYIHTTGFPRSGNTWLGKLMADAVGGLWLPDKSKPPISVFNESEFETQFLNKDIIVTKNHKTELPNDGKSVFIYRDPRDAIVSMWFYRSRKTSLETMIEQVSMVNDPSRDLYGPYETFIRKLWNVADVQVSYERLHFHPADTITDIIASVGLERLVRQDGWLNHVDNTIARQSFSTVKSSDPEYFHHSMRKGVVGDWQNYFDYRSSELITKHLGALMIEQGYIDSLDWYR
jgi:hypothetical protein